MDSITFLFKIIDSILIAPYRWSGNPLIGWWLGTFILGMWCTLLGEISLALAFRVNRAHVRQVSKEMQDYHHTSMHALRAGDKGAFKDINRLANEAYGRNFFLGIAMASSSLWPVACALGWMQIRFSGVEFALPPLFPVAGKSVGYAFVFIPVYILIRMATGKLKGYLLCYSMIRRLMVS
jgi:hypothetical protein